MIPDPPIKLQRIAADDLSLADVRPTESARNHAAQVVARLEQDDLQSLARCAYSGDHSSGRSPVHHHVKSLPGQQGRAKQKQRKESYGQESALHQATSTHSCV